MASKIKLPVFIDVSYWTIVEWEALSPIPWLVIAKASEGFQSTVGAFVDPRFHSHAQNIKARGIRRGAYHFLRPGDVGNQAEFFVSVIKQAGFDKDDILVLDWEDSGSTLRDAIQWLEHIERVTGQRPIIYSSAEVVERLYAGQPVPPWFREYWWWPAGYPLPNADRFDEIPAGYIPRGLTIENVAAWQYDEDGIYPGIQGNKIDMNWLNPPWMEAIKLTAPTGGTMPDFVFSITPVYSDGSKVRKEHAKDSLEINKLQFTKYAFGNVKWVAPVDDANHKKGDEWLNVWEVNGVPLNGWIAGIHMGVRYATITQISTPTEPPPTPPAEEEIVITQTFAATRYVSQTTTTILKPE